MEKLTVTLHIRVSPKTAEALKRLADADHRKLAPYIGLVLDRHVAERAEEKAPQKRGR
jgi:Mn-dependent DtxR family transcriptional regulator